MHHIIVRGIDRLIMFKNDEDRNNFLSRFGVSPDRNETGLLCLGSETKPFSYIAENRQCYTSQ